ncbi:MAG: TIGR04086 family membrane protein [Clostridiales bacterium]|jgi:putative membrane protein (TIGR04086 family)|nr:TIGR04086 family membrane protein [Clostridiales bacterium]
MKRIKIEKDFVIDVLRASAIALLASVIAVIAFAFIFKALDLDTAVIEIGNAVIKLISIFAGAFLGIRVMKHGILKGVLVGALFLSFSIAVMKIFNSDIKTPIFTLLNVASSLLFGAVSGVFAVNFKRKR